MLVADAFPKLDRIIGRRFSDLFSEDRLDQMMVVAKGRAGKLLEMLLGLPPGIRLTDFEDGELKTNKSRADGTPLETMFISQISTRVDSLLRAEPFDHSWVYEKIRRIVYLPVVKVGAPAEWYFKGYYDVRVEPGTALFLQLKNDYASICEQMRQHVDSGDGMLHTSSGKYLQIRTKDAKPYHPIYSDLCQRNISNKNFAFYFRKQFMLDVQEGLIP